MSDSDIATSGAGELIPQLRISEIQKLAAANPQIASDIIAIIRERAATRSRIEHRQQYIQILGVICGLAVAVLFGYWSYALLSIGQTIGGGILATADLGALVTAFIASSRRS